MPALQLFLIGAPRSGKSTVFNALTLTPEGQSSFTKGQHHLGTVKVPDARLAALRDMYKPAKYTPAEVTFVDVAMPPTPDGKGALSQLTTFLGDADAFVIVAQAFGEMDYRGKPVDPADQLESVLLELVVTDLERTEKRLEKIAHEKGRGLKINEMEASALEKCRAHMEKELPLRTLTALSPEEEKATRSLQLLSAKPVMVIANVSEERLDGKGLDKLRAACAKLNMEPIVFCASLEAEMAQLDPEAQSEFLKDYGLNEPARVRFIQMAYRLLDLISFFTVGEDEVRAWTIRRGTQALHAAGKIHTDLERGFIRAEVVRNEELLKTQSWAACQKNATLRLEGKTYEVQDGDVMHIRHNA
ncbi:MAG: Ribosome-binding ATPase YchF [Verrucomicrobia bacterium ADurb.Bin345]|nr:MAG: Ribosome-binding ATPase YchF [Verrucomicrobia bacterium ADurb.Bin345]